MSPDLSKLDLRCNNLGAEGAAAVAAALADGACPGLTELTLSDNGKIGDARVAALAATLVGGACPGRRPA